MNRSINEINIENFLSSFSDIFKLALDAYRSEYAAGGDHYSVLNIYGRENDISYIHFISKNQSALFAVPGSFTNKHIEINIREIFNTHKVFLKNQIKSIKVALSDGKLFISVRNKNLNIIKMAFDSEDYDVENVIKSLVKPYKDDDNLYNISVQMPTINLIKQILNNQYENVVRAELHISSNGGLDVFPGLIIGTYKKETIEDMINFAENILKEQEKAQKDENDKSESLIPFHLYIKRDIETMKNMLKKEKDEYHIISNLPMAYIKKVNNEEYDSIRKELLWRVYNCRNLQENEVLIEPKDIVFLANLSLLDGAEESILEIKANSVTKGKLFILDMYRYKMYYIPAQTVSEEDKNLFVVYGMRARPITEGFDEEKLDYLMKKVIEISKWYQEYVNSEEYENYLATIFPLIDQLKDRLKGQSWFERAYERAKELHERYKKEQTTLALFRQMRDLLVKSQLA